jgi:fumarylacetoacetase
MTFKLLRFLIFKSLVNVTLCSEKNNYGTKEYFITKYVIFFTCKFTLLCFSTLTHQHINTFKMWFPVSANTEFSLYNLPFGIFSAKGRSPRIGVALGEHIIDLRALAKRGVFDDLGFPVSTLNKSRLNDFAALGARPRQQVRQRLQDIFSAPRHALAAHQQEFMVAQSAAAMHLPVHIGDYTDFYSSEDHATNVGKMFRDPANALLPNWKHLPVGYHGRASSIAISGTNFRRPKGQTRPDDNAPPVFGPTQRLDFELEMAAIIGQPSALGDSIAADAAEDHIFGFVLFNDWSARDIQKWEYVPLGPFLAKNFFSSISPWVVTPEALEPFRMVGPVQQPAVLPYLQCTGAHHFDVPLSVSVLAGGQETLIVRSNFKYLYWSVAQQIAHHTVNGCNLNPGDVLASGTISGPTPDSFGSMLELTWGGQQPLTLSDGSVRKFIQDGDTVIMRATAEKGAVKIGFGEVRNTALPAF